MLREQFELLPVGDTPTHIVESSLTSFPVIVERTSVCGRLKMHAPSYLPEKIEVTVEPVESLTREIPDGSVAGRSLVMQGEIVRSDMTEVLISHGGLLFNLKSNINKPPCTFVRTTISF